MNTRLLSLSDGRVPKRARTFLRARVVTALAVGVLHAQLAAAETLTLMWDLNTEPEVTGYQVHIGQQPGVYTQAVDVGNTDTFVFTNATGGQQYCFAVTAYAGTLVSPLSAEVCGATNRAPFLSQPFNQTNSVTDSVTLQLAGGDPDGQPVTYSASGLPPGLTVSQTTGFLAGVPTTAGVFTVTATVSDGALSASRSFTWTINPANQYPPVLTNPGPRNGEVGQLLSLQLSASDPDSQLLTFSANGLPPGLVLTTTTGRIEGIATAAGAYTVTAGVFDGAMSAGQTFVWTIRIPNQAPSLTSPGHQASDIQQPLTLQLQASDVNNDPLTFSASGLPPGLQIGSSNGQISGTPTAAGVFAVTAAVSDGVFSSSRAFTWTIRPAAPVSGAPSLANPGAQQNVVGQTIGLQLNGQDPGAQPLTYSATGLPPGLQVAAATGRISGQPTTAGVFTVAAAVSNGTQSANQGFTWTITPVNVAPVLASPGNQSTQVGQAAVLQLQGSDPNGDTLTYSASGLPAGLQLASSTGRISGAASSAGTATVTVSVSDGALTAQRSFTWTVSPANVAPALVAPGNQAGTVGDLVSMQLQATDANGDLLVYSATGVPPGIQLAADSGWIGGTLTTAGSFSLTVTVSDGTLSAARSFIWTVASVATPPVPGDPPVPDVTPDVVPDVTPDVTPDQGTSPSRLSTLSVATAAAVARPTATTASPSSTRRSTGSIARARNVPSSASPVAPRASAGTTGAIRSVASSSSEGATLSALAASRPAAEDAVATGSLARESSRGTAREEEGASTADVPVQDETGDSASARRSTGSMASAATASLPSVAIQTPVDTATFAAGDTVHFVATAADANGIDLARRIVWTSSLDGRLGTGPSFTKALSAGTHVLTASVTDRQGRASASEITVAVR